MQFMEGVLGMIHGGIGQVQGNMDVDIRYLGEQTVGCPYGDIHGMRRTFHQSHLRRDVVDLQIYGEAPFRRFLFFGDKRQPEYDLREFYR